jgi:dTDP-4-dehydrorhamnose reductase
LPNAVSGTLRSMAAPILVTGRTGQLAVALAEAASAHDVTVRCLERPTLDIEQPASIAQVFATQSPSLVINAAAYTNVDAAEDNVATAFRANRDGPAELARWCAVAGIPLIHISTDFVFDGRKGAPYVESDIPAPQGVYGASKLAGEQAVLTLCPRAVVLRTAWLYSPIGKNFVRTMLAAGERNSNLRVVADQIGCPTSAEDLAQVVLGVAAQLRDRSNDRYAGIYHAAGAGAATWHELATVTFAEAKRHGRVVPSVDPISTQEWPTKVRRPPDSRLDCSKLAAVFGLRLPAWKDSVRRTVDTILRRA